jgi:hypothetical protein
VSDYVDRQLRLLREAGTIKSPKPPGPPRDSRKFWDKVKRGTPEECWPWQGYKIKTGHGLTQYKSVSMYASRKAYILTHGPLLSTVCVNHRCDNAACCNPAHLYIGTRADNMIDRFGKIPADERGAGRKRVLSDEQLEALWEKRRNGAPLKECAKFFGVHVATICRYITARRKISLEKLQAYRRQSV